MITLDMCLEYIAKHGEDHYGRPINLFPAQKRFLANLCDGKLTDTPRCFGKTFVIGLYCKALDYYTDAIKWGEVDADDYISLSEMQEGFGDIKLLSENMIRDAYYTNPKLAMREYNFDETDFCKEYGVNING